MLCCSTEEAGASASAGNKSGAEIDVCCCRLSEIGVGMGRGASVSRKGDRYHCMRDSGV